MRDEKMDSYLRAIAGMGASEGLTADYVFLADMDHAPCISRRRGDIVGRYSRVEFEKVFIVVDEIEGWYAAGLTDSDAAKLGLRGRVYVSSFNKEDLAPLCQVLRCSPLELRIEMLNRFSWDTAVQRSDSFRYFVSKQDGW